MAVSPFRSVRVHNIREGAGRLEGPHPVPDTSRTVWDWETTRYPTINTVSSGSTKPFSSHFWRALIPLNVLLIWNCDSSSVGYSFTVAVIFVTIQDDSRWGSQASAPWTWLPVCLGRVVDILEASGLLTGFKSRPRRFTF